MLFETFISSIKKTQLSKEIDWDSFKYAKLSLKKFIWRKNCLLNWGDNLKWENVVVFFDSKKYPKEGSSGRFLSSVADWLLKKTSTSKKQIWN